MKAIEICTLKQIEIAQAINTDILLTNSFQYKLLELLMRLKNKLKK